MPTLKTIEERLIERAIKDAEDRVKAAFEPMNKFIHDEVSLGDSSSRTVDMGRNRTPIDIYDLLKVARAGMMQVALQNAKNRAVENFLKQVDELQARVDDLNEIVQS